jgi:hypothetical protein
MLLFIEEGGISVLIYLFYIYTYIVIPIGIYNKNMIYTII